MPAALSPATAADKASRTLSVCDGARLVALVYEVRGKFLAFDADDRPLGQHETLKSALAALPPPARGGGHG
jgi:hypothetical protein